MTIFFIFYLTNILDNNGYFTLSISFYNSNIRICNMNKYSTSPCLYRVQISFLPPRLYFRVCSQTLKTSHIGQRENNNYQYITFMETCLYGALFNTCLLQDEIINIHYFIFLISEYLYM